MNANAITANSYHKVLKKVPKSMKTSAITQDCYHSMEKITKIYGKQTLSQRIAMTALKKRSKSMKTNAITAKSYHSVLNKMAKIKEHNAIRALKKKWPKIYENKR